MPTIYNTKSMDSSMWWAESAAHPTTLSKPVAPGKVEGIVAVELIAVVIGVHGLQPFKLEAVARERAAGHGDVDA